MSNAKRPQNYAFRTHATGRDIYFNEHSAMIYGVSGAIVLKKIMNWLEYSQNEIEGKYWVYNTYADWQEQLPFYSEKTIKRAVAHLKKLGVLETGNHNKLKADRTLWYTVNFEKFIEIENAYFEEKEREENAEKPAIEQKDKMSSSKGTKCPDGKGQNVPTNTNTYSIPTNTKKIKEKKSGQKGASPIVKNVIDYLNQKAGKRFSEKTPNTIKLINGRLEDGYTEDDLKAVIDIKTKEWSGDEKWGRFLRPETLFRPTKFENYLNQETVPPKKQGDQINLEEMRQTLIDAFGQEPGEAIFKQDYGHLLDNE